MKWWSSALTIHQDVLWSSLGSGTWLTPVPRPSSTLSLSSLWLFGMFIGTDLTFSNFLNFIFTWDRSRDPHVLYVHMTYDYSFLLCFNLHTIRWPREVTIVLWSFIWLSEIYSTDAPPPSFSSTSSTTAPPLNSPSMSINDGPTWRRIPPGREEWLSGRSRLYPGGLASLQTRHCQGRMGPSIKEVSTAGWTMLSGTLTGLGKVRPPIVVRRVVPVIVFSSLWLPLR